MKEEPVWDVPSADEFEDAAPSAETAGGPGAVVMLPDVGEGTVIKPADEPGCGVEER
jgi:hypothetical protein